MCFLQQTDWPYMLPLPASHSLANKEGRKQTENEQAWDLWKCGEKSQNLEESEDGWKPDVLPRSGGSGLKQ